MNGPSSGILRPSLSICNEGTVKPLFVPPSIRNIVYGCARHFPNSYLLLRPSSSLLLLAGVDSKTQSSLAIGQIRLSGLSIPTISPLILAEFRDGHEWRNGILVGGFGVGITALKIWSTFSFL
eukprot:scaffold12472_cov115-Cylindrotheca_fusiformis.AAC.2